MHGTGRPGGTGDRGGPQDARAAPDRLCRRRPLLLDLAGPQLLAVVLCSALPTAQNAFIYAGQYGLDTTLARNSVVASTVVSMATLSLAAWVLGPSHG